MSRTKTILSLSAGIAALIAAAPAAAQSNGGQEANDDDDSNDDDLMHYEIPDYLADPVEKSPNIIVYSLFPDHEPIGYKVPLLQGGDMY